MLQVQLDVGRVGEAESFGYPLLSGPGSSPDVMGKQGKVETDHLLGFLNKGCAKLYPPASGVRGPRQGPQRDPRPLWQVCVGARPLP